MARVLAPAPAAALAALAAASLVALASPPSGATREALPLVAPQPVLGAADAEMRLMGAATESQPGEAWGYRRLPAPVGPPVVDGRALEFGQAAHPESPDPQLAFLRYTDGTGWQVLETPLDEQGRPYRGAIPNDLSARTTPHGGGLLVGRDQNRPADHQVVVLVRDPGGRFRVLPEPPPDVLLPQEGVQPAEQVATEFGTGEVAAAAYEREGKTEALFAAKGRATESAVVRWDGGGWSREPVELPAGAAGSFRVLALAASGPGNAWMLARLDPAAGRGLVLLERQPGPAPRWAERDLGSPLFASRSTPSAGVEALRALEGASQPLTVTPDGVWMDGSLVAADGDHHFTVFFDRRAGRVTGSWCDAGDAAGDRLCLGGLGVDLSEQIGYVSIAWPGDGYGSRVITNPLDTGGGNSSNRGTYLRLDGDAFVRMAGAGGNFNRGGAFASPVEGWLEGPVHITAHPEPGRLGRHWPLSLRSPLTSVATAPGAAPGALDSPALAVGLDGAVARYEPGRGWTREFVLTSSGAVSRPALRGVAWPEPSRANAVGDSGAMWLWRSDTGLWEKDPAAPIGFEAHLMDIAFDPADPQRGYAVGRTGALLRYGKSWEQDALPAGAGSDFTQVAFAGRQALVAAGTNLLVNDGSGWRVDEGARALLRSTGQPARLHAVAGLPDGGAVAAGEHVVIERDGPGSGWRFSDQPIPNATVVAAAAFRDGARVRAVVSVQPRLRYPPPDLLPEPDPNVPPPILPAFPPSADGYVLRETATGWRDEEHTGFRGSGADRPLKSDPILDFALDSAANGWAVGGWSGEVDSAGRGSSGRNPTGRSDRQRVQTAAALRYGDSSAPPGASGDPIPLAPGPVRLAVAGHAQCEQPCADLGAQAISADIGLEATLAKVAGLRGRAGAPRFMLYTGGRLKPGTGANGSAREAFRYAQVMSSAPSLPVYGAVSPGDLAVDGGLDSFRAAFAPFNAPWGDGPAPPGIAPAGASPGAGAHAYYAFDSSGPEGAVRTIVIDNASGALDETQKVWLRSMLAQAGERGMVSIVAGSRDLNSRFTPSMRVARDADEVARILVEGGASAYFFERPEENRTYRIPAGASDTIPAFGTGTLGYRSALSSALGFRLPTDDPASADDLPDALFGDAGYLLVEVDAARRDPATNRAPVSVRTIPLINDLSLQALDGVLLRRSRPALFQGIGRRPQAGDRWGRISSADGNANPPGSDPHVNFPPLQCLVAGCSTRLEPEYEFTSSDPDIGDFVRQDPQSANLRKPFIGPGDKVVTDSRSALFCPFNAGSTTVTVRAGGLAYAQVVRVQPGTVQRPCGTRPLRPDRFKRASSGAPATPPPAPAPQGSPPVSFSAPSAPPPSTPPAQAGSPPPPPPPSVFLAPEATGFLPPVALTTPPPAVRPSPPSGGMGRAYQVEEKREEEAALEESQAFARYQPDDGSLPPAFVLGVIVLAAFAGATIRGGPRARGRRMEVATVASTVPEQRRRNAMTSRHDPYR